MVIDNTGGRLIGLDEFIKEDQIASHFESFYDYFGYRGTPHYSGTIFRFPLRTGLYETNLPNNVYNARRVETSLFKPFQQEIENCLLFMKSVNKISVSVKKKNSSIQLLYSAEIDIAYRKRLALHRRDIFSYIENRDYLNSSRVFLSLFATSLTEVNRENRLWFTINILGLGSNKELQTSYKNQSDSYLPWFALAIPLPNNQDSLSNISSEYCWSFDYIGLDSLFEFAHTLPIISLPSQFDKFVGNLFCFLPIAASSHFPFHIHGYFSLSTNRRSIKWPRFDELSEEAKWNRELSQTLGTVCYAVLIYLMVSRFCFEGGNAFHYGLWSCLHHSNEEDQLEFVVHKGALELLQDTNLVWNRTDSTWIPLEAGYYLPSCVRSASLLHEKVCVSLLLDLHQPLVDMPTELADVIASYPFLEHRIVSRIVTPQLIRTVLVSFRGNADLSIFLRNQKNVESLLEIILSDLDFSSLNIGSRLNGIQLIPVCNCEIPMVFGDENRYFISEVHGDFIKLFPGLKNSFIRQDLHPHIFHSLLLLSRTNQVNIEDITNLRDKPEYFVEFLKCSMSVFSDLKSPVKWRPANANSPQKSWIELIWKFIDQDQGLINALEKNNFPILPQQSLNSSQIELLPIKQSYMPYIEKSNIHGYSGIESLLVESGCYICHRHIFILPFYRFVKLPIPQGFFSPLLNPPIQQVFLHKLFSADDSVKLSIINIILSIEFNANGAEINVAKSFPIFRSVSNQWVSLNPRLQYCIPPDSVPKDFTHYPDVFLSPFDSMNTKLCSKLGIQQISLSHTIQYYLLPLIVNNILREFPQQRNTLSLWILRNVSHLEPPLINILSNTNWLLDSRTNKLAINTRLFSPRNLYDSQDEYFKELLMPNMQGIFPNEIYNKQNTNLLSLGLISSQTLSYANLQTIISIILRNIAQIQPQNYTNWLDYLVGLVNLLMDRFNLTETPNFWTIFQQTAFILPSPKSACNSYPRSLPYSTAPNYLYPQNIIYCSEKEACLIAAVAPVLIEKSQQKASQRIVFEYMGVSTSIPLQIVCQQFALVAKQTQFNHNEMHSLVKKIYKYFARSIESGVNSNQIVLPQKFVFIPEYGFFDSQHVVLSCEDKFFPFIFSLSKYYPTFDPNFALFFKTFDIQPEMGIARCNFILQQLRTIQLSPEDVTLAIKVIQLVGDSITEETSEGTDLLVLAQDRIIYPAVECLFNDLAWLQRSQISTQRPVVHQGISCVIANKLGCRPASFELAPTAESISYSFMTGAGQSEDLVDRLRGILEGYRMHTDVFNELIQNSDDAGATKVKVLFDYTSYPCKSVLHKNMEAIHGPALYIFNNAKFTARDFESILRLSSQNKLTETEKIGRFGIGFNAVYNFTDCPSFVSDDSVQIFDPLQKYVGDLSKDSGVRIRFADDPQAVKTFHDQFQVYQDLFDCNVINREAYEFTLFRFPFRVSISKLSNQTFDKDGIAKLQCKIVQEISNLILFLQNVNSIEIFERKRSNIPMRRILKVSKNDCSTTHFLQIHKTYFQTYKNQIKNNVRPQNIVSSSDILTVDTESKEKNTSVSYLIAYASGIENCFDILRKFRFSHITFLPICGVAIPLHFIENIPPHLLCKLYTFLPLPIRSPLYLNINCYFSLSQSRKNLSDTAFFEETESDILTEWNLALINDALPNALIRALETLPEQAPLCNSSNLITNYYSIWPVRENTNLLWKNLPEYFANKICQNYSDTNLFLCAHSDTWISFEIVSFLSLDNNLFSNKDFTQLVYELSFQKQIQFANIPQSFLTSKIFQIFSELCPEKVFDLQKMCIQILFPSLQQLSVQDFILIFNTLIPICFETTEDTWLFDALCTTPFIPCGSDADNYTLRIPSDVVCPNTKLSSLYQPYEMRTPVPDLYSSFDFSSPSKHYTVLIKMCVIYDKLPRDEIIGRCSITTELSSDIATQHAITLIGYLNSENKSELIKSAYPEFKCIPFVPTYCDELSDILQIMPPHFAAPNQCYTFHCRYLVSPTYPAASKSVESISNCLCLQSNPSINIVIEILFSLVSNVESIRKSGVDIRKKILEIYTYFSKEDSQIEVIKEKLKDTQWVWHPTNMQFYASNQVILSNSFQSVPENTYLVSFPYMETVLFDKCLKEFLIRVGIKERIEDETIIACIDRIRECEQMPLSDNLVQLILKLIDSIQDYEYCSDRIFVLSQTNMLNRPKELYIVLPYMELESSQEKSIFVHTQINMGMAFRLGVKSPEELYSSEYDITDEDFGIQEEITDRIQTLVREMPVHSLIKELIQNAEDSGATEIVFILDEQDYSSYDKTLSLSPAKCPNWKSLHTFDSLSVYNNRGFSEEDIKGIQKLSVGGKFSDQSTIGKFGLGFNSVYHITDAPTFITHRPEEEEITLCCFDPFLKYTFEAFKPKNFKGKRGKKFTIPIQNIPKFKDQLFPFTFENFHDNPEIAGSLKGMWENGDFTMFRFPLDIEKFSPRENTQTFKYRKAEARKHCSLDQVKNMIIKQISESSEMLLFLNNVKTLKVVSINKKREVTLHCFQSIKLRHQIPTPIPSWFPEASKFDLQIRVQYKESHTSSTFINSTTIHETTKQWVIYLFPTVTTKDYVAIDPTLSKYTNMYCEEKMCGFGGIAVCTLGFKHLRASSNIFSFLPVGATQNFPAHIHAPLFIDSSRQHVHYKQSYWADFWHTSIIKNILAPLYSLLLVQLRHPERELESIEDKRGYFEWFYSLFPVKRSLTNSFFAELSEEIYNFMYDTNQHILLAHNLDISDNTIWYPLHGENCGVFLPNSFFSRQADSQTVVFKHPVGIPYLNPNKDTELSPEAREKEVEIRKSLILIQFPLTFAPKSIMSRFNGKLTQLNPNILLTYLSNSFCCLFREETRFDLSSSILSFKQLQTVLEYILTAEREVFNKSCVPIRIDIQNNFLCFELEKPCFTSTYANLLPLHAEMFISTKYDSDIVSQLLNIGFVKYLDCKYLAEHLSVQEFIDADICCSLFWMFVAKSNLNRDCLNTFGRHLLVPVRSMSEDNLIIFCPINQLEYVVSTSLEISDPTLYQVLVKLKCPLLSLEYIKPHFRDSQLTTISSYIDSLAISQIRSAEVIISSISLSKELNADLLPNEVNKLLQIIGQVTVASLNPQQIDILSFLKIFKTQRDEYLALFQCNNCFVNNERIPLGPVLLQKLFVEFKLAIFESRNQELIEFLCHKLGKQIFTLGRLLSSMILYFLPEIPIEEQKNIIIFIAQRYRDNKLIPQLANIAFILSDKGQMLRVNQFYSPDMDFFTKFLSHNTLPEVWRGEVIRHLIDKLGLMKKVSMQDIRIVVLRFSRGEFPSSDLPELFNAFAPILLQLASNHTNTQILSEIAKVRFLPVWRIDCITLNEEVTNSAKLVRFRDGQLTLYQNCCCTTSWVHRFPFNFPKDSYQHLKIIHHPDSKIMRNHLITITRQIVQLCPDLLNIPNCFRVYFTESYKYLEMYITQPDVTYDELVNLPCILWDMRLFYPINMLFSSNEVLHPFVIQLPAYLAGNFPQFLKRIGVEERANFRHFALVLLRIFEHLRAEDIKLSDSRYVQQTDKVFNCFIGSLRELQRNSTPFNLDLPIIYLLTRDAKLVVCSEVIFADNLSLLSRVNKLNLSLNILKPLEPDENKSCVPPNCLGLKKLSELLIENIDPNVLINKIIYPGTYTSQFLQTTLNSPVVFRSMRRLYFHLTKKDLEKLLLKNGETRFTDDGLSHSGFQSVLILLNQLRVVAVRQIDTVITDNRQTPPVDHSLSNSCSCYINPTNNQFLLSNDQTKQKCIQKDIAYTVNTHLGGIFTDVLSFFELCFILEPAEIMEKLNEYNVILDPWPIPLLPAPVPAPAPAPAPRYTHSGTHSTTSWYNSSYHSSYVVTPYYSYSVPRPRPKGISIGEPDLPAARLWLLVAQCDLLAAQKIFTPCENNKCVFPAHSCFFSFEAVIKVLTALLHFKGSKDRLEMERNLRVLIDHIPFLIPGRPALHTEIEELTIPLMNYDIGTRIPNSTITHGVGSYIPQQIFTLDQAREAKGNADRILELVTGEIPAMREMLLDRQDPLFMSLPSAHPPLITAVLNCKYTVKQYVNRETYSGSRLIGRPRE